MTTSKLHTYTLEEIAAIQSDKLLDENIHMIDLRSEDIANLRLNYPCKGDFISIIILVAGTARIKVDFETADLETGSMVSTFPNNILEFESISSDYHIQGMLLSVKYISELQFQVDSSVAMDLMSSIYSKFLSLDQETFMSIKHILDRLTAINRIGQESYFNAEIARSYITTMFYELADYGKRVFNSQTDKVLSSPRKEDLAVRFATMVGNHFRKHRDVLFYADQLHISRKHLTKIIKMVYGLTPKQIIDGKVIAEAKVLLQKSELNVAEVMTELNFDDQSAFSKFFKKNTGAPPLSYRYQIINS